jgi:acyl-CoA thioester hydrolase
MARHDFTFAHSLRVRWAEADMQGVVFNGHYLTYFDVAVTEYWRAVTGGDLALLRETFDRLQVVNASIDFHAPARFDDVIDVCARTARFGGTSMRLLFEIHRGDQLLISGHNVYVHVDGDRPVRVPDALRERVARFERLAPES